jgi:hypothetical protein
MVFSTVQISMPGTSCAPALADISTLGINDKDVATIIRPIIESLIDCVKTPENSQAALSTRCQRAAGEILRKNILQPHSGAEIWQDKRLTRL